MFQVGDAISYGTSRVCRIVEKKSIKLAGQWCDCYILQPVYDHSLRISVPCGSEALLQRMRPLPTREELLALLREPAPRHEADPALRREIYRRTLQSGDRRALLEMVRDLYAEQRRRHAAGRQLSGYEDGALREARNILHSEFAYTLGMDPGEVPDFIARELREQEI